MGKWIKVEWNFRKKGVDKDEIEHFIERETRSQRYNPRKIAKVKIREKNDSLEYYILDVYLEFAKIDETKPAVEDMSGIKPDVVDKKNRLRLDISSSGARYYEIGP